VRPNGLDLCDRRNLAKCGDLAARPDANAPPVVPEEREERGHHLDTRAKPDQAADSPESIAPGVEQRA
jgi:hypothetical protein